MRAMRNQSILIKFYVTTLFVLLLSVIATPMLIRAGLPLTRHVILEEETVETALIIILFGISFFILKGFLNALGHYRRKAYRAGREKNRLVSRLAEAFSYIGTVNVELQEIASVLCGVSRYPESRRAFRQLIGSMADNAMTLAAVPWLVVRMIDRDTGKTIDEHTVKRCGTERPTVVMGNRAILEDRTEKGIRTIVSRQQNLDVLTVFILPAGHAAEDQSILLGAILNQIEMLFLLFRSGCLPSATSNSNHVKHAH